MIGNSAQCFGVRYTNCTVDGHVLLRQLLGKRGKRLRYPNYKLFSFHEHSPLFFAPPRMCVTLHVCFLTSSSVLLIILPSYLYLFVLGGFKTSGS